jgi:tryptophan synthase alpha chain
MSAIRPSSGARRLAAAFAGPGGKKALVIYVTAGDPSAEVSVEVILAAARAGADVIELGVPFSEPSADGPAIQRAMERALARGGGLPEALEILRRVRAAGCDVPVVLFGYFNPVFVRGVERFCHDAAAAGADGVLIVDLPVDELAELVGPAHDAGLAVIPLAAPTSGPERLAAIAALAAPFVYYVAITGVTGAALGGAADLGDRIAALRGAGASKVAVGFGVATPEDARRVGQVSDGVVVGTAIVRAIEGHVGTEAAAVSALVASLRGALG